jgi:hypothetical protein
MHYGAHWEGLWHQATRFPKKEVNGHVSRRLSQFFTNRDDYGASLAERVRIECVLASHIT